ncbi:MAG TPA: hypothetical protein VM934_13190 [Pyrinomonadaceae bacterium]|jgi:hypothetical protein|nr:hypothetical protein [Pyrinomonadaceae bacterium]
MSLVKALGSGLVGACALTLIHESARRLLPNAPRMDVLGMRAIANTLSAVDKNPPPPNDLHEMALVGDIVSNSVFYSLVGAGSDEGVLLRGSLLGLAAGLGAVFLPEPLGLGRQPDERAPVTQLMTIAWYVAGGLAAAAAFRAFSLPDDE